MSVHYLRVSNLFHGETRLNVCPWAAIRPFLTEDAEALFAALRTRNPFARHRGAYDFYTSRAQDFANTTVVELMMQGIPPVSAPEARLIADRVEQLVLAATTLWLPRRRLHWILGISSAGEGARDLYVGPRAERLSSRSHVSPSGGGLVVDAEFERRWNATALSGAAQLLLRPDGFIPERVDRAFRWLYESRFDPHPESALVKAVIGLENLFVQEKTEPLARTISERLAYVLGRDARDRAALSRIAQQLYDARSRIVHGGTKARESVDALADAASRLVFLAGHALASRAEELQTTEHVKNWVDEMRWGVERAAVPDIPFSSRYIRRVIRQFDAAGSQQRRARPARAG